MSYTIAQQRRDLQSLLNMKRGSRPAWSREFRRGMLQFAVTVGVITHQEWTRIEPVVRAGKFPVVVDARPESD